MEKNEFDQIVGQLSTEAQTKINGMIKTAEDKINGLAVDAQKGLISKQQFEEFKTESLNPLAEALAKLEKANQEQGIKMKEILEKKAPNSVSFEDFLISQKDKIKEARTSGKFYEITGQELKAAGISSIGNTMSPTVTGIPGNPYAPGPNGPLSIFELVNNPNFITSKIDLGRTDKAILPWANELTEEGSPAKVAEGAAKPLISSTYKVEVSTAQKIAAYEVITEEFDQDLPGFATAVRRKIEERVIRFWDDSIQTDVMNAATPFNITSLNQQIFDANMWDGLLAMVGQVGYYNFNTNGIAINALTDVELEAQKGTDGHYLNPPFAPRLRALMSQANKMSKGFALVGDFKQFKVDIYKDFVLKIGWINDDFIKNQFCVLGEMRYHSYMSTARKKALVYHNMQYVANQLNGTPHS